MIKKSKIIAGPSQIDLNYLTRWIKICLGLEDHTRILYAERYVENSHGQGSQCAHLQAIVRTEQPDPIQQHKRQRWLPNRNRFVKSDPISYC